MDVGAGCRYNDIPPKEGKQKMKNEKRNKNNNNKNNRNPDDFVLKERTPSFVRKILYVGLKVPPLSYVARLLTNQSLAQESVQHQHQRTTHISFRFTPGTPPAVPAVVWPMLQGKGNPLTFLVHPFFLLFLLLLPSRSG